MRIFLICLLFISPKQVFGESVVLFLGDGMGVSTVTAARIFAGQQKGLQGEEYSLAFEDFDNLALVKTYNTDAQVPDSAGTISAILTGEKTRMGVSGIKSIVERGDCKGALENQLPTLLEAAEQAGFLTGIVSTARITHATPAGTYAHFPDRNWENNSQLTEKAVEEGCLDIARQLTEFKHGDGIDVILGGGRSQFLTEDDKDPEYAFVSGKRTDGRNLITEWLESRSNRSYVWSAEGFSKLNPKAKRQFMGLFEPSHLQFEADRPKDLVGEPSLAEMTEFAIKRLQHKNKKGFFLLVEGGRIDHGHHAGNAYRALTDTVAFSEAVEAAKSLVDPENTLIIVTADHSHTLTISGYPSKGNPILGLVDNMLDATSKPYTTLGYANGPGYQESIPDLSKEETKANDYRQIAAVPLYMETHAGEDVPAYATGPNSGNVSGSMEQNELYGVMYKTLFE